MQEIRNVSVAPHSVELTTNAKGKVQASVKVYDEDPKAAADKAVEVLKHLTAKLGNSAAGAE